MAVETTALPAPPGLLPADISWFSEAACRGTDPDLFFPSRGENYETKAAKQVCAECTVCAQCLEYALQAGIKHGIFGGTSERERRRMRRTPVLPPAFPPTT